MPVLLLGLASVVLSVLVSSAQAKTNIAGRIVSRCVVKADSVIGAKVGGFDGTGVISTDVGALFCGIS